MIASIAGVALALQLGLTAHPLNESIPLVQEIRYRRHGRSPPCGHGYDLDERDDKCYPNGTVPRTSGTVGGVAFKAHQLGLPLKARSQATAREFADLDWTKSHNAPPASDECH